MNNFNDMAKTPLDEWIYFLKNQQIKDSFKAQGLKQAKDRLDILRLPDNERGAYERFSDDLHYQASMVVSRKVDSYCDGLKEGREDKGREVGDAQSRPAGLLRPPQNMARPIRDCESQILESGDLA